jgi:hypothetical protein
MLSDWMDYANCGGGSEEDAEKFFDRYLESEETVREVHVMCTSCPVNTECFNFGTHMKATGVWGGRWLQNGRVVKKIENILSDYFWRD